MAKTKALTTAAKAPKAARAAKVDAPSATLEAAAPSDPLLHVSDEELARQLREASDGVSAARKSVDAVLAEQARRGKLAQFAFTTRVFEAKRHILPLLQHSRTSCSDSNPTNGFAHYENGAPRCMKCALIRLEDWQLDTVVISLDLQLSAL